MSANNDGGPAFPGYNKTADGYLNLLPEGGMSLRDYFAGQALAGMIGTCTTERAVASLVPACWKVADAMLAARETDP